MIQKEVLEVDILICGAGVVGLAIAMTLAKKYSVAVIEQHSGPARETSSHNSGVIHAGIYYETGSLKHRLCQEGNSRIYEWCQSHSVDALQSGKLIVAFDHSELDQLQEVYEQGIKNTVRDFEQITTQQIYDLEPEINVAGALWSPWTGVVDAYNLAKSYERAALDANAFIAYQHKLTNVDKLGSQFVCTLTDTNQQISTVKSDILVNSAGLMADQIGSMVGYPLGGDNVQGLPILRQSINRGRYYDIIEPDICRLISRPIYPLPDHQAGGLGVHLTTDTNGGLHLGPSMEWMKQDEDLHYLNEQDEFWLATFLEAGIRFLPHLKREHLAPGQVGYRPKIQKEGEGLTDFLIWKDEGYIHLGGIESPGLTASLPIADQVAYLIN